MDLKSQKSNMRLNMILVLMVAFLHAFLPTSVLASLDTDSDQSFSIEGAPVFVTPGKGEIYAVTDTQFIEMGVIVGQMKYDKPRISVKAGEPVVIVFKNNDVMMHNILILESGTLDEVGMAADKMIADPKAQEKGFIPELDAVLHASPLVNPGKTYKLIFTAPNKKGEYPYVCTFPGHWRLMQGVMKVE